MMKKRFLIAALCLSLLCSVLLSGCGAFWAELLSEAEKRLSSDILTVDTTEAFAEYEPVTDTPFVPRIVPYTLPRETFSDPVEEEAAALIDGAIEKAIACVNAMRDDRRSRVCYPFDEDANGYISALSAEEQSLYRRFTQAAENGKHICVTDEQYGEILKTAYYSLYPALTYASPATACYFDLETAVTVDASYNTHYTKIFDRYFDPYYDQNTDLSDEKVTMEKILHSASLLDHVVKRVVRLMPTGLSTYDQYYYLAAVLSAQASYDKRPRNCYTAFGALICGKAVCEGYSCAYYLLCKEADLWCAYRNGLPEGTGHQWNMIRLESGIYNVDVTWCDGGAEPYEKEWYECFVRSDAVFEADGHCATSGVAGTGMTEPDPYE